jgi:predicted Fe-Mo cluster-binding NifX family protein
MKIAVATTDKITVNEHFGRTENFSIFVITSDGPVKVEEVRVEPLSTGNKNHPFDKERFQSIAEALKGCERVYVTKIGERPAAELQKIGIEPVVSQGEISSIGPEI